MAAGQQLGNKAAPKSACASARDEVAQTSATPARIGGKVTAVGRGQAERAGQLRNAFQMKHGPSAPVRGKTNRIFQVHIFGAVFRNEDYERQHMQRPAPHAAAASQAGDLRVSRLKHSRRASGRRSRRQGGPGIAPCRSCDVLPKARGPVPGCRIIPALRFNENCLRSSHVNPTQNTELQPNGGADIMRKPPGTETSSAPTVRVLLVSPSDADHAALCEILQQVRQNPETNCRWLVCPVISLESVAEVLEKQEIPIVISDDSVSPGTWQMIVQRISLVPDPPLLIVTSRWADEHLWAEALNLGAWDVLAKPFSTEEVIRVVNSAWRHWQDRHGPRTGRRGAGTGT